MSSQLMTTAMQVDSEQYEDVHVHRVYEQIAEHFSSTRYKPWPIVEEFLRNLPHGSIGIDVGCGNGKYLKVNPNIFILGSDRSTSLVRIASQHSPQAAVIADNLSLPHPHALFDFAISIAVIHHLSTPARRIGAIAAILETLQPCSKEPSSPSGFGAGGRALIYVWALEQKHSRRGWDEDNEQDVMVPWVMKQVDEDGTSSQTFNRYYHLYRRGELEEDILQAGGIVDSSGYEKDNWWAVATRRCTQ
ncbi:tRNA methyltransferase, has a role in tRNA modification [Pseudocyphellaria aurata]|nr:tRNA methyltransferase, has a role in tRNA modification [Pseudocyphellaria aurata]